MNCITLQSEHHHSVQFRAYQEKEEEEIFLLFLHLTFKLSILHSIDNRENVHNSQISMKIFKNA